MLSQESDNSLPADTGAANWCVRPFVAPTRITAEYRLEFRRLALEALQAAASSGARVVEIDLGAVVEMDATGLGVLILVQKRARELALRTRLLNVPMIIGQQLDATRLEPLFEIARDG